MTEDTTTNHQRADRFVTSAVGNDKGGDNDDNEEEGSLMLDMESSC